jgi:Reverse transcriptase (RNA-dependent DNA polymerase)
VKEGHSSCMAFKSAFGTFEYTVMPFRLVNTPTIFQRCPDGLLRKIAETNLHCYFEDIIICGATKEEKERLTIKGMQHLNGQMMYEKENKTRLMVEETNC